MEFDNKTVFSKEGKEEERKLLGFRDLDCNLKADHISLVSREANKKR